jgi:hypothetical protein
MTTHFFLFFFQAGVPGGVAHTSPSTSAWLEEGCLTPLLDGPAQGTGTFVLDGHHEVGGIVGVIAITTDGTNDATVVLRENNASGKVLFDLVTLIPMTPVTMIGVKTTQVVYYSVSGTGAKAQFFEWHR